MDLRSAPRYPIQCPIAFSGDLIAGRGTVTDVSRGGWRVASDLTVQPGTYLTLQLCLPDKLPPLQVALAAVCWSRRREFGLEYLRMGAEEQERLRRFVSTLESTQNR